MLLMQVQGNSSALAIEAATTITATAVKTPSTQARALRIANT